MSSGGGSTTITTTTGGGGGGGPASQASLSVYLSSVADTPGAVCPAGAHWINVPFAANGGQQATATAKGSVAVDGVDQIGVTCSVRSDAGAFAVSASLRSPAFNPATGSPVSPTLVSLSTHIAEGRTAMGAVSVVDVKTATVFSSVDDLGSAAGTCTFSVAPSQAGEQLAVAPGRIWASVTCPRIRDTQSANTNEMCAIPAGVVILENCAQ